MQIPLFHRWIDGRKSEPTDGQKVLAYNWIENPEEDMLKNTHKRYGEIVICGPVVRTFQKQFVDEGLHRKVAFWQPLDELPKAT